MFHRLGRREGLAFRVVSPRMGFAQSTFGDTGELTREWLCVQCCRVVIHLGG